MGQNARSGSREREHHSCSRETKIGALGNRGVLGMADPCVQAASWGGEVER